MSYSNSAWILHQVQHFVSEQYSTYSVCQMSDGTYGVISTKETLLLTKFSINKQGLFAFSGYTEFDWDAFKNYIRRDINETD